MHWQGRVVVSVMVLSITVPLVFGHSCNAEKVLTSFRDFSGSLWLLMFSGFWLYHRKRSSRIDHLRILIPKREAEYEKVSHIPEAADIATENASLRDELASAEREAKYARKTEELLLGMAMLPAALTLVIWVQQHVF